MSYGPYYCRETATAIYELVLELRTGGRHSSAGIFRCLSGRAKDTGRSMNNDHEYYCILASEAGMHRYGAVHSDGN